MKKTITIVAAIASLAFCSCVKENDFNDEELDKGNLIVNVGLKGESETKAPTAYTGYQAYEKKVNKVQILVFDSKGRMNNYIDSGTSTSSIKIETSIGAKTIWAVVNGPSLDEIITLDELKAKAIDLSINSTTESEGFLMSGHITTTVSAAANNELSITVQRHTARVALQKVTNNLPKAYKKIKIKNVMLTNVVGNQNIEGSALEATWYNQMGRVTGTNNQDKIIDGSVSCEATCPSLTFHSVENELTNGSILNPASPYLMYAYPNSTSTDVTGWMSSFSPRKTRLIVSAEIEGQIYYYPMTLDKLSRNTSYTIELVINGLGSEDPDQPVVKGVCSATITVADWISGSSYEEKI